MIPTPLSGAYKVALDKEIQIYLIEDGCLARGVTSIFIYGKSGN